MIRLPVLYKTAACLTVHYRLLDISMCPKGILTYKHTANSHQSDIIILTRSSAIAVIADHTACSILTLFIVTATSRSLNKKSVCCQSANPINNYCGSASANPQSAHLSARALQSAHWAQALVGGRTERHSVICH